MFSTYSVFQLPPGSEDIELFFKDEGVVRSKLACSCCRASKRKCDRTVPECKPCRTRQLTCTYRRETPRSRKLSEQQTNLTDVTNVYKQRGVPDVPKTQGSFMKQRYPPTKFDSKPTNLMMVVPSPFKSLETKWKSTALVRMILCNSKLDKIDSPMYISNQGRFEYYGHSPIGPLLTTYFDLNPSNIQSTSSDSTQLFTPSVVIEDKLITGWIADQCIESFFKHYYQFFPIVNEDYLQAHPDPLLIKLIIGIGCKYLPSGEPIPGLTEHLDDVIFQQFKVDFPKPRVDVAVTLILIGQYQVVVKEFKRAWIYQSYYNLINIQLGTHRNVPRYLKFTDNQIRLRCHQWWGACIGDKLNTFLLNRPMLIAAKDWILHYPKLPSLPKLSSNPSNYEFRLGRDYVSSLYLQTLARMCDLMGHAVAYIKIVFPQDPTKAHMRCQNLLNRFFQVFDSFHIDMKEATTGQPDWLQQLAAPLISFNSMVLHTVIIRLSQYFLHDLNSRESEMYLRRSLHSATTIVQAGEDLGSDFYRYGTVYRYYAVASATLVFAFIIKHHSGADKHPSLLPLAQSYMRRGLDLLHQSRPYQQIVEEFYHQLTTLVGLDTADLTKISKSSSRS